MSQDNAALRQRFDAGMEAIYRVAKEEWGYNATYFLDMLYSYGGLETAHRLLGDLTVQYGFTRLWECGRLDLTVEALVLKSEFVSLFSNHELEIARLRLVDYGYVMQ
jgi:hypothetical protein